MSILRGETLKLRGWAPKAGWLAWRNYDFQLTTYAVLLTIFGLVMAYSTSVGASHAPLSLDSPFVRSLMWAVIAVVVLGLTTVFDYRWLRSFAWPLYLVNIGLLILTLGVGRGTGEAARAARWVLIGGFQLQFSELAKIVMVIVFASYLAHREQSAKSLWTIVGAILIMVPPWVLVMLQPDLGTSLVLVAMVAGMLFMSGASLFWLGTLAMGVVGAIPIVWNSLRDYQQARLLALFNPSADPNGAGFQLHEAQMAVNAGGVGGKGITNGTVVVPVGQTDFVWGVLAEELGFIGSMVVIALFVLLLWRLLVCSWRSPDRFAMLLGSGLATMLFFQVFVNIGMVVGLVPVTGIPLPFISYGGASLVSLAAGLGIVQSTNLRREKPEW
jgi:rod shape determining protein RodA